MLTSSSQALDRVRVGDCMRPTILSCAPETPITDVACAGDGFAASDIAATEAVTAASGDSLRDAAKLMAEHGVSHLIVLGQANGEPVGVLSSTDILAAYAIASGARSET
jgi:CBS-domain-containing membrane protein